MLIEGKMGLTKGMFSVYIVHVFTSNFDCNKLVYPFFNLLCKKAEKHVILNIISTVE